MVACSLGAVKIPFGHVIKIFFNNITGNENPINISIAHNLILWKVRLPRVLTAAIVGMVLSISGVVFQAVFRNPMAEPFILGISAGSSLGAATITLIGSSVTFLGVTGMGLGAFAGAGLSLIMLTLLLGIRKDVSTTRILLGGVMINFFLSAIMSLLISLNRELAETLVFWGMGSFASASWKRILFIFPFFIFATSYIFAFLRELNLLSAGESTAHAMGINVPFVKISLLIAASIMTAAAVSISGTIGFVGLIIPHAVRFISGPDHKRVLPLSIFAGGSFLIITDLIARMANPPMEIPIGVVTSIIGAPLFFILLKKGDMKRG